MDAERRLGFDDDRRLEAKGLARAKARARRLRVSRIRSRTIRGSLALFAVLWGIIFVQLASGNDPALSRHRAHHQAVARVAVGDDREPVREPAPEAESDDAPVEPEFEEFAEPEAEFEAAPEPVEPIVTSVS